MMTKLLIVGALILIACSTIQAKDSLDNETDDFFIILSNLLNVNQFRHSFIDDHGERQIDSLQSFKEFDRLYSKYIKPDGENKTFSQKRLKVIMLLAFYADQHNAAAFQEYLASDLLPIYNQNSVVYLNILRELPFLVGSNCDRLNAYFGFEGKNAEKKPGFITKNKVLFKKHLSEKQLNMCLNSFK